MAGETTRIVHHNADNSGNLQWPEDVVQALVNETALQNASHPFVAFDEFGNGEKREEKKRMMGTFTAVRHLDVGKGDEEWVCRTVTDHCRDGSLVG